MPVLDPQIEKKYEILAKMAEGGMGEVYKVRHRHLGSLRVIKTSKFGENETDRARFLSEAERGAELNHRGIARVYDFDLTESGMAYIVMEYIDGVTLRHVLAAPALPVPRVVEIVLEALEALQYLHDNGFVHRDISPENLMIATKTQQVKLIDLGIAKSLEHSQSFTADGKFIGKVKYAAPEQFRGEAEPRTDLYSLGLVMYELLTGTLPYRSTESLAIMYQHASGEPLKRFDETDPNGRVPRRLREIVMRALEREPIRRFDSARDFSGALRQSQKPEKPVEMTAVVDVKKLLAEEASAKPAAEVKEVSDTIEVVGVTARELERLAVREKEDADWKQAEAAGTSDAWREYLGTWPESARSADAKQRLADALQREAENLAWDEASLASTVNAFQAFLQRHPGSARSEEARQRLQAAQLAADEAGAWQDATRENSSEAWNRYLAQFGKSERGDAARTNFAAALEKENEAGAYAAAEAEDTSGAWNSYLEQHGDSERADLARRNMAAAKQSEEAAERAEAQEREAEQQAWSEAERVDTAESWHVFTMRHPRSPRIEEAKNRLARATMTAARDTALRSGTADDLRQFRREFPGSEYDGEILAALQAKEDDDRAWKRASTRGIDGLAQFVKRYPQSSHLAEAQERIAALQKQRDDEARRVKEARQALEAKQAAELEKKREEQTRRVKDARDEALRIGTIDALDSFLRKHPRSEYETEIRAGLQAKQAEEEKRQREEQARRVKDARDEALRIGTIDALSRFLRRNPGSPHEQEISEALEAKEKEERAWKEALSSIGALQQFISAYPQSQHAGEARERLEKLRQEQEARQRRSKVLKSFKDTLRTHSTTFTARALAAGLVSATILGLWLYVAPVTIVNRAPVAPTRTTGTTTTNPIPATSTAVVSTMSMLPPPSLALTGQLLINASPWGEVKSVRDEKNIEQITGQPLYTPARLTLPVGRYVVQLSNPKSNKSAQCIVLVVSGQTVRCERPLDTFNADEYLGRVADSQ